jgi:hypothetical protein
VHWVGHQDRARKDNTRINKRLILNKVEDLEAIRKGRSHIHSREKGALYVFHGKVYRRCNRTNITVSQVHIIHARKAYKSGLIKATCIRSVIKVTRIGSVIKAAFIRSVIKVTRIGSVIKAAFIRSVIKVQATRVWSVIKVKATGVGSVVKVKATGVGSVVKVKATRVGSIVKVKSTRVGSIVKVKSTSSPVRALCSITKAGFIQSIVGSDIRCLMVEKEFSVGVLVSCNSLDSCSNPSEPRIHLTKAIRSESSGDTLETLLGEDGTSTEPVVASEVEDEGMPIGDLV